MARARDGRGWDVRGQEPGIRASEDLILVINSLWDFYFANSNCLGTFLLLRIGQREDVVYLVPASPTRPRTIFLNSSLLGKNNSYFETKRFESMPYVAYSTINSSL